MQHFEPDSNNQVLRNYLNIKSVEEMEALEEQELERAELELLNRDQYQTLVLCLIPLFIILVRRQV